MKTTYKRTITVRTKTTRVSVGAHSDETINCPVCSYPVDLSGHKQIKDTARGQLENKQTSEENNNETE